MQGVVAEFERWERQTRGYAVWPAPVDLEPPYTPFLPTTPEEQQLDDGRRPGLFATWFGTASKDVPREKAPPAPPRPQPARRFSIHELQLVLPDGFAVRANYTREFLRSFHNLRCPLAFELIGFPEGVVVQLCCGAADLEPVKRSLRGFFPEVKIREHADFLTTQWNSMGRYGTIIDFGLSEYCFYELRTENRGELDPLINLVSALDELRLGELGVVQLLFQPALAPWAKELWQMATEDPDANDAVPLLKAKFSEPPYAVVIRIATLSNGPKAAFDQARTLGNALIAATRSTANMLIPLDNDTYPDDLHAEDLLARQTRRSGMILSEAELLSLAHLPNASVRSSGLIRQAGSTKRAPDIARRAGIALGLNEHDGEAVEVRLGNAERLKHMHIIGASGTGKSTLLLQMITEDMEAGSGLALLDPHGDLVDDVLARVPAERDADVVLIDPADPDYSFAFNILSAHSELERTLLASDLVSVFQRLSTSWGDQMTAVLGNAVLAFLESTNGGTLLDLRRFLIDPTFRKEFLATVRDPETVQFWRQSYPLLKGNPQAPLLTRLDAFLRPKRIRYMVGQTIDHFDVRALMDDRKIILARLSQGAIGEENAQLLGSLLTARISQAAASRQEQARGARVPFFLYMDEFHHFITPSVAGLLTGVRKYGVGLVLAHQNLRQVQSRSEEVSAAVLSSAFTRIVFRVSEADAKMLADGFADFEPRDLQSLGVGRAIARIERPDYDFNLRTAAPGAVGTETTERIAAIQNLSRTRYSTPSELVAAALAPSYEPISRPSSPRTPVPDPLTPTVEPPEAIPEAQPQHPEKPEIPVERQFVEERTKPVPPVLPGRGGPQHKYLQALVKQLATDRGYRVTLEKPVLDGTGHIDALLERDGFSIGCEISITTPTAHETQNLSKCLASGCDLVLFISSDKKGLKRAETAMSEEVGEDSDPTRLRFVTPDALPLLLDEIDAAQAARQSTIQGYRVKVKYRAVSPEDLANRQRMVADVISTSLRRAQKKS